MNSKRLTDALVSASPASEPVVAVDVGIPTRGTTRFLQQAIESVLDQSLTALRLTVSENGPGSEAVSRVVERYLDDPRFHHVVTGRDLGMAGNFTSLIRSGGAPFVALLHDDDRWKPEFLARRVEFLEAHPECGFVFSAGTRIDESGRFVGRRRLPVSEGVHSSAQFVPLLYRSNVVAVETVVVRRSAYESVGSRYNDSVAFIDHEMWLRLAARFDVGCLAVWDAEYRVHADQETSRERLQIGEKKLQLLDSVEVPLPDVIRRRARSEALIHCALDALERGERAHARHYLSQAIQRDPRILLHPPGVARTASAVLGLALGGVGRRAIGQIRERRWQRPPDLIDA